MTVATYQRFETPGVSPGERFEYWRSWYSQAVDAPMQLDPIGRTPRDFRAGAEVLGVGQVDLVELTCGPAIGTWAREGIESADRLRLALVAPAPGTGAWHGCEVSLARGAVALLGGTDGRWCVPRGWHAVQVNVPRRSVAVSDREVDRINDQPRLLSNPVFAQLIRPSLLGLAGHLDTLAGEDLSELGELWISLVNMLVRSLTGDDVNGAETVSARRHQIRRYIRAHLADPRLAPATIAQALHVSRRTLYASLAPGDESVAAEIRHQRLARAHALLSDPADRRPIAEIGAAVGLPNPPHFSRLFRARYGVSPGELRDAAGSGLVDQCSDLRPA